MDATWVAALAAITIILVLGAQLWQRTELLRQEFFQMRRAAYIRQSRLIAGGALAVAVATIAGLLWVNASLRQGGLQVELARIHVAQAVDQAQRRARAQAASERVAGAALPAAPPSAAGAAIPTATTTSTGAALTSAAATPPPRPVRPAARAVVGADRAIVRAGPAESALFVLPRGADVSVLGTERWQAGRGWTLIAAADGRQGWIATSLVNRASDVATASP
jgi:hypothetical protein